MIIVRRLDDERGRDARILLLPCGRIGRVVLVGARTLAADAAVYRVVCERQIVDRRDEHLAVCGLDAAHGECTRQRALFTVVAKIRQLDLHRPGLIVPNGETRADLRARVAVLLADVPFLLIAPALGECAVRDDDLARFIVHDVVAEISVLLVASHVARGEHAPRDIRAVRALFDAHEEREVRVFPRVLKEERNGLVDVVFLQDHMSHRHGEGGVTADLQRDPRVREHRRLGVVGRDGDDLRPLVAHL